MAKLTKEQLIEMVRKAKAEKTAKDAAASLLRTSLFDEAEIPPHMDEEAVIEALQPTTTSFADPVDLSLTGISLELREIGLGTEIVKPLQPSSEDFNAGITYTDEQQAAIDAGGWAGKSIAMTGFAGTGKTTTAKGIMQAALQAGRIRTIQRATKYLQVGFPACAVVSYTNKAVKNIQRQMPDSIKPHTITLHKLLQYEPVFYEIEDPATGQIKKTMRFEPRYNASNPLPHELGLVVFEESSMIGIDLYANYRAAVPHKPQEIFLGDLNQLPPVFGSAILGFAMLALPTIQLTKPQRQAAESSILRFSWDIKDGNYQKYFATDNKVVEVDHPTKPGTTISKKIWNWATSLASQNSAVGRITVRPFQKKLLESHAMLTCVTLLKQWSQPNFSDPLLAYNPEEDMILTPFNKAFGTIELNKQIAQFLGERRSALVHEIIAGYNKYYLAVGDRMFFNKEECVITNIARNGEYMGKIPQPASINLDRWGNFKEVGKEEGYHKSEAEADEMDLEMLASLTAENIEDRVNAASHTVTLKFTDDSELEIDSAAEFNAMLGGYALTVHKAQGSEWQKIFIFLHHTQATMHSRELLYTAVTRAKTDLVILCEPDSIEKCIRNARLSGTTMEEKIERFKGEKLTEFEQKLVQSGALF